MATRLTAKKQTNGVTSDNESSSESQRATYTSSFKSTQESKIKPSKESNIKANGKAICEKSPKKRNVSPGNEEVVEVEDFSEEEDASEKEGVARTSRSLARSSIERSQFSSNSSRRSSSTRDNEQELPSAKKHKSNSNEDEAIVLNKKIEIYEKCCDRFK